MRTDTCPTHQILQELQKTEDSASADWRMEEMNPLSNDDRSLAAATVST